MNKTLRYTMVGGLLVVLGALAIQLADACTCTWYSQDNPACVKAYDGDGHFSYTSKLRVCTATGGDCQASGNVKDFYVANTPGLNQYVTGVTVNTGIHEDVDVGSWTLEDTVSGVLNLNQPQGQQVLSAWDGTEWQCSSTFYKTVKSSSQNCN
jgi:hypothetical protein